MLGTTERACLVIADISGYTGYLAGSELDHAQDVLADLLEVVIGNSQPLLRLAKLEGDAVFTYVPEQEVDPSLLLDTLETCYFAFRRRLEAIRAATTCRCNACAMIPHLNLKFCVHAGNVVRQRIAGHEELAGSDVILVHRLLKNAVSDAFALKGYALFSAACLGALQVDPARLGLKEHRETYEHFGEVLLYVHDLEERWRRDVETRRERVSPEDADIVAEHTFEASPPALWEIAGDPVRRPEWVPGVERVDQENPGGRRGVGTTNHCVHGEGAHLEEVLDYRPFEYLTWLTRDPAAGDVKNTLEFVPEEGRTRVRMLVRVINPQFRETMADPAKQPMLEAMGREYHELMDASFARLAVLVQGLLAEREQSQAAAASAQTELREKAARYWEGRQVAGQPGAP